MKKYIIVALCTTAALALSSTTSFAQGSKDKEDQNQFVKRGTLTCTVAPGIGFVLGSSKSLKCAFRVGGKKKTFTYAGAINKLGLDIGITGEARISWTVFANPKTDVVNKITGTYSGLSAEAAAGIGLGAKALIGSEKQIALQPLKLSGGTGVNVALGVASMTIQRTN